MVQQDIGLELFRHTFTLVYDMVITTNQVVVDGLNPLTAYTAYVNPTCPNGEVPQCCYYHLYNP